MVGLVDPVQAVGALLHALVFVQVLPGPLEKIGPRSDARLRGTDCLGLVVGVGVELGEPARRTVPRQIVGDDEPFGFFQAAGAGIGKEAEGIKPLHVDIPQPDLLPLARVVLLPIRLPQVGVPPALDRPCAPYQHVLERVVKFGGDATPVPDALQEGPDLPGLFLVAPILRDHVPSRHRVVEQRHFLFDQVEKKVGVGPVLLLPILQGNPDVLEVVSHVPVPPLGPVVVTGLDGLLGLVGVTVEALDEFRVTFRCHLTKGLRRPGPPPPDCPLAKPPPTSLPSEPASAATTPPQTRPTTP